jgi:nucleoside-diphosphate-sugar epimerase
MKTAIVTGADGFIGRHLTRSLCQHGYEVYAFTHKPVLVAEMINKTHYLVCDLHDMDKFQKDVPNEVDIMFHFAWEGVRPELRNDFSCQLHNIDLTLKCLEFAAAKKVKRVLFPGSTNEYLFCGKPINDDSVPSPKDAYGSVKIALKYLAQQYARQNGFILLYAIIAGIYAEDRRDNNVIFYTINCLLNRQKPSLTKLEQLWDYVYVDDVIRALVMVGERGKADTVYAIGHGDNWPLRNYIEMIRDRIDPSLPLGIGEVAYKEKTLPMSCIDLTNLQRDTGFIPQVSFNEGIDRVITSIKREKKLLGDKT